MRTIAVTMALLMAAAPALADDLQVAIEKQLKEAAGMLVTVRFSVKNQEGRTAEGEAMAVCIDSAQRIFMTMSIPTNIPLSYVDKDSFRIIRPSEPDRELKAQLRGIDLDTGLSFVRCDESVPFKAVAMVHSTGLKIGEPVIAVGLMSQGAGYAPMVDVARVSARVRAPTQRVLVTGQSLGLGSSPVFNLVGQMVGLVAPDRDARGRMFIPIEEISHVVRDLPEKGQVRERAWLGLLRISALTKDMIDAKQIKRKAAIKVADLLPDGPTAKAGIVKNDVIVAVNGTSIKSFPSLQTVGSSFQRQRMHMKAGSKIILTVVREGKEVEVPVIVGRAPLANSQLEREFVKEIGVGGRQLGVIERYANKVDVNKGGMIVDYVRRGSGAAQQFKAGDWVVGVNGKDLGRTFGEFGRAVREALKDTSRRDISFHVRRRFQDGSVRDEILTFPKGS